MVLETAATAAIVSAAKPLVEPFVEKFVTTKLQSFAEWCKKKHKEVMIPKTEHFQKYLERMYEKYSIINTLAFDNSQRKLKEVYVAQTLVKCNSFNADKETALIDSLPVALIRKYKKILITDTAGMGKSTIMKRMFIDLIDNCRENVGIPIYIELNSLDKNRTIVTQIQKELSTFSKEFDKDLLQDFIQTGGFVFFLDGYDEISITDRKEVADDIKTFISKAGTNNYYILTSRPEDGLASFGDFQSFEIQPLTKDEAFALLEKYDLSWNKVRSKTLIETLKSEEYHSIDEYLENPLLVSLLFTAYNYKQKIPLKKHRFYRQVYDALFEAHKVAQGQEPHKKRSGLDIDDFDRVLRFVGYECLIKLGVQFDEDTILKSIDRAKLFCGNLKFGNYDFLKDLRTSVPLFIKEGTEYKWAHKSLMEYFAARFIADDAKENQDKILTAIYKSKYVSKYINMLDIYYDIDFKGFSKNITLPICERYVQFYNDNMIVSSINKDLIEKRIGNLFVKNVAFLLSSVPLVSMGLDMWKKNIVLVSRGFPDGTNVQIDPFGIDLFGLYSCETKKMMNDIIKLLFKKRPSLFTIDDCDFFEFVDVEDKFKGFEKDRVYVVDMKLGEDSETLYKAINERWCGISWWFNYEACKEEIDRIKKEIAQYDNPDSLFVPIDND